MTFTYGVMMTLAESKREYFEVQVEGEEEEDITDEDVSNTIYDHIVKIYPSLSCSIDKIKSGKLSSEIEIKYKGRVVSYEFVVKKKSTKFEINQNGNNAGKIFGHGNDLSTNFSVLLGSNFNEILNGIKKEIPISKEVLENLSSRYRKDKEIILALALSLGYKPDKELEKDSRLIGMATGFQSLPTASEKEQDKIFQFLILQKVSTIESMLREVELQPASSIKKEDEKMVVS